MGILSVAVPNEICWKKGKRYLSSLSASLMVDCHRCVSITTAYLAKWAVINRLAHRLVPLAWNAFHAVLHCRSNLKSHVLFWAYQIYNWCVFFLDAWKLIFWILIWTKRTILIPGHAAVWTVRLFFIFLKGPGCGVDMHTQGLPYLNLIALRSQLFAGADAVLTPTLSGRGSPHGNHGLGGTDRELRRSRR